MHRPLDTPPKTKSFAGLFKGRRGLGGSASVASQNQKFRRPFQRPQGSRGQRPPVAPQERKPEAFLSCGVKRVLFVRAHFWVNFGLQRRPKEGLFAREKAPLHKGCLHRLGRRTTRAVGDGTRTGRAFEAAGNASSGRWDAHRPRFEAAGNTSSGRWNAHRPRFEGRTTRLSRWDAHRPRF